MPRCGAVAVWFDASQIRTQSARFHTSAWDLNQREGISEGERAIDEEKLIPTSLACTKKKHCGKRTCPRNGAEIKREINFVSVHEVPSNAREGEARTFNQGCLGDLYRANQWCLKVRVKVKAIKRLDICAFKRREVLAEICFVFPPPKVRAAFQAVPLQKRCLTCELEQSRGVAPIPISCISGESGVAKNRYVISPGLTTSSV